MPIITAKSLSGWERRSRTHHSLTGTLYSSHAKLWQLYKITSFFIISCLHIVYLEFPLLLSTCEWFLILQEFSSNATSFITFFIKPDKISQSLYWDSRVSVPASVQITFVILCHDFLSSLWASWGTDNCFAHFFECLILSLTYNSNGMFK